MGDLRTVGFEEASFHSRRNDRPGSPKCRRRPCRTVGRRRSVSVIEHSPVRGPYANLRRAQAVERGDAKRGPRPASWVARAHCWRDEQQRHDRACYDSQNPRRRK
jgi:hypothetical protein